MLVSQGWNPGSFLGTKNALRDSFPSDADASYVKLALKDDNLGLGAKHDDCREDVQSTGLDNFRDLLGRLNGKQDTKLKKEQNARNDSKRAIYTERRWGVLGFVSGGVLIGDRIQELAKSEELHSPKVSESSCLEDVLPYVSTSDNIPMMGRRLAQKSDEPGDPATQDGKAIINTRDYVKISIHGRSRVKPTVGSGMDILDATKCSIKSEFEASKSLQTRATKKQRKLDRRRRRISNTGKFQNDIVPCPISIAAFHKKLETEHRNEEAGQASSQKTSTPSLGLFRGVNDNRHAVRRRYIQHKQMAMLDSKALNEVSPNRAKF